MYKCEQVEEQDCGDETSRSNFGYIDRTNRFHPARRQPITGPPLQPTLSSPHFRVCPARDRSAHHPVRLPLARGVQ